ncbi:flagellar hook-associated protein FlgL [Geodermatophilus sabuli]|uniref:Flagellar hook-associated protein 3 FlgL n=1 Tax=Geodermatophilus sabuli TaxID=1564158 RepID=A0A285EGE8_9ACTN|nr:flagellar hook-associated protein FlgL [Geodermatophilus sabuli]MBB3083139.1 flagellar hook-associated protein 3 FlgL [Geodermatophilus sabuli]SNX98135.1 flagellar hook-associated protein 3 FlgL [Geodermatophilus sabuli]
MRITQRAVALTSLQGLNRNLDAVGHLQQQLTSGRAISAPSDSPTGANRAMQTRGDQAAVAQQARNLSDGRSWVEATDTALTSMTDMTRRIRDLTVQAQNTGALSAASKEALAAEVKTLREGLLAVANQTIQGRPLFGGVTNGGKAYNDAGEFIGDASNQVKRRISDTEVVRIDVTGPEVFGADDENLFAVIERIGRDITADPARLAGHLTELDAVTEQMLTAMAGVGARALRIEKAEQVNADRGLDLTTQLSAVEGIDLPKTIMELEMQKVGYEAALSATAKALQPTLVDFLR